MAGSYHLTARFMIVAYPSLSGAYFPGTPNRLGYGPSTTVRAAPGQKRLGHGHSNDRRAIASRGYNGAARTRSRLTIGFATAHDFAGTYSVCGPQFPDQPLLRSYLYTQNVFAGVTESQDDHDPRRHGRHMGSRQRPLTEHCLSVRSRVLTPRRYLRTAGPGRQLRLRFRTNKMAPQRLARIILARGSGPAAFQRRRRPACHSSCGCPIRNSGVASGDTKNILPPCLFGIQRGRERHLYRYCNSAHAGRSDNEFCERHILQCERPYP